MTATNPTTLVPEHDITLTAPDGGILHFVLTDGNGDRVKDNEVRKSLSVNPLAQSALQTFEGGSKYSDKVLPYQSTEQTDWTGGRGSADFENDTTRFYDNYRTQITSRGVILGGAEHYSTGIVAGDLATQAPQNIRFTELYLSERYVARSFVASSSYSAAVFYVYLRFVESPQPLTLEIWTNSGGSPGALVGTATVQVSDVDRDGVLSEKVKCTLTTPQALVGGTTYHFVARANVADSATSHWLIGCNLGGKGSSDGVTWGTSASMYRNPWFRINAAETPGRTFFFDYKGAQYLVITPDGGGNSTLWISGDRGVADSNVGALTTLIDATKSANWVANEFVGFYVHIFSGPGSEEATPYRLITGNTTTALTVETPWIIPHTVDTQYVIIGSNKFRAVLDASTMGGPVTDVAIAGDFVYFARGDSGSLNVRRFMWWNNYGTAENNTDVEFVKARNLVAIRHPENDEYTVYGSLHTHDIYGVCVWKGNVPPRWGSLYRDMGTLLTNNQPFDESLGANITTVMDEGAMKITIAAAAGVGVICSKALPAALDITAATHIAMLVKSDVANDGNDIQISRSSSAILGDTEKDTNMGLWYANVPQWCTTAITPAYSATTGSNDKAIISFGFKLVNDQGAQNIWIYGPIKLMTAVLTYIDLPNDMRINRLVAYSGNQTDPRENPWVITEGNVYEIQTQNNNVVVPIPIKEMAALKNYQTGQAAAVNDVYLYFNLFRKIERYFGRNLDDVGPDRDEGLPWNRRGDIAFLISYPGRVIAGIDAGSTGYSSVYVLNGNGWHELYRAAKGERIRSGGLLSMPNTSTTRLYLGLDSGPLWIPLSVDPFSDNDFPYTFEGTIENAWVYTNLKAVKKAWKSIALFQDNTAIFQRVIPGSGFIFGTYVDYMLDAGLSWTTVADGAGTAYLFDSYPHEEHNFSAATPPNVTAYRIRTRLRIQSNSATRTPLVLASVIDSYCIIPVKYAYSFTCTIAEDYLQKKLGDGGDDLALGTYDRAETAYDRILTLANAVTPMWWNSRFSWCDAKTVILQPPPAVPLYVNSAAQQEAILMQLTCHDI